MKIRFLYIMIMLVSSACNFDLDDIEKRQNDMEERLLVLEKWKDEMNRQVTSLLDFVTLYYDLIESREMIVSVEPFQDDSGSGYKLTFEKNPPLFIYHGTDGEVVEAPVIGVEDDNGTLYWTQTINGVTTPVLGEDGNKLAVVQGVAAVTPVLGINADGYWTIDWGQGATQLLDEDGVAVLVRGVGCLFSKIDVKATYVEFTLATGEVFKVPLQTKALETIVLPIVDGTSSSVYLLKKEGEEVGLLALEYNPKISATERKLVFYLKGTGYKEGRGNVVETGDFITFMGDTKETAATQQQHTSITLYDNGTIMLDVATPTDLSTLLSWEELVMTDNESATYNAVKVGGNIWTQRNLNTMQYRDGTAVATNLIKDGNIVEFGFSNGARPGCAVHGYLDANAADGAENRTKYGLLYNVRSFSPGQETVQITNPLTPEGWIIPSIQNWNNMFNVVAELSEDVNGVANKTYTVSPLAENKLSAFNAKLGGRKWGAWQDKGVWGHYASRTTANGMGYNLYKISATQTARYGNNMGIALSVRCVREL